MNRSIVLIVGILTLTQGSVDARAAETVEELKSENQILTTVVHKLASGVVFDRKFTLNEKLDLLSAIADEKLRETLVMEIARRHKSELNKNQIVHMSGLLLTAESRKALSELLNSNAPIKEGCANVCTTLDGPGPYYRLNKDSSRGFDLPPSGEIGCGF